MDNAGWSETFRRLLSVATDSAAEDARSLGSVAQRQSGAAAAVQNTVSCLVTFEAEMACWTWLRIEPEIFLCNQGTGQLGMNTGHVKDARLLNICLQTKTCTFGCAANEDDERRSGGR
jgi:hypothetical protein